MVCKYCYMKDFNEWNIYKTELDSMISNVKYAHAREIWWCSLGVNVGVESDGKNNNFERPVLIMKVYNKESIVVLPITTKAKNDPFHFKIYVKPGIYVWVKLTQVRMVSNKRLQRKVDVVSNDIFLKIRDAWIKSLF